jgi:pimeloyl-ACP methyl ester carboxylesterase
MDNPIVFIHGSGDSARVWRPQLEELGSHHPVYAIDLPGHGQRPDTLPAEVTVWDFAQAACEIIQNELAIDHPIIAGHSLGGAIALAIALEHPTELGGLILIGTGARLRVLSEVLASTHTTPREARHRLIKAGVTREHAETIAPMIWSEQVEPGPTIIHRDLAACDIFDCMARLSEIHLPTLIICGTEDRATPMKYSQYLHEHIANSTLQLIPEAAHYVFREQPEAVNQAIREWITQN